MSSGVLGIVGCYGLSDQILHLVDRDDEIENLLVVNNLEGRRFADKCQSGFIEEVSLVTEDRLLDRGRQGFSVILWLNPEDLHNTPSALQLAQDKILTGMSSHVDSILSCYGLCRSSEERTKNLIKQTKVPLTFLTDAGGEIVDDCFAAILGGREAYLNTILRNKGTLFASTGYVEAWRRKREPMDIESMVYEVDQLRYMFKELDYRRIIKLDDGTSDPDRFERDVRAFARTFDLELATIKCQPSVFERSYDCAKGKIGKGKAVEVQKIPTEGLSFPDSLFPEQFSMLARVNLAGKGESAMETRSK